MNLIHKKNISLLKVIQNRRHLPGLFDRRAGSDLHVNAHLVSDDSGEGRLSKTRRAVKKHMIQRVPPLFCRLDIDLEISLGFLLAHIITQKFRPERALVFLIFFCNIRRNNSFRHMLPLSIPYFVTIQSTSRFRFASSRCGFSPNRFPVKSARSCKHDSHFQPKIYFALN